MKEEAYALPPLGLLVLLAKGEVRPEMAEVLAMTDKLRSELPNMLAEHARIVEALGRLADAAEREGNRQVAQFAEKLKLHAQTEEQVLYPAAIVLGDYLRLKLNKMRAMPGQAAMLPAANVERLQLVCHPDNFRAFTAFYYHVLCHWLRCLRRRSQHHKLTWRKMMRIAERWLPSPKLRHPYPDWRFDVMTRGGSPVR